MGSSGVEGVAAGIAAGTGVWRCANGCARERCARGMHEDEQDAVRQFQSEEEAAEAEVAEFVWLLFYYS